MHTRIRGFFKGKLKQVDTSEKKINETSYEVTKDILDSLIGILKEEIAYFESSHLSSVDSDVFEFALIGKQKEFRYAERDLVEANEKYVQPIPICVITDEKSERVIIARKLSSATSIESPERNRDLIYFGGHIREEDSTSELGIGSILQTANTALSRELKEELDIDYDATFDEPKFCIWKKDDLNSKRHVALVYHVRVDPTSLRIVTDQKEFSPRSTKVINVSGLRDEKYNFEPWSSEIIRRLFI